MSLADAGDVGFFALHLASLFFKQAYAHQRVEGDGSDSPYVGGFAPFACGMFGGLEGKEAITAGRGGYPEGFAVERDVFGKETAEVGGFCSINKAAYQFPYRLLCGVSCYILYCDCVHGVCLSPEYKGVGFAVYLRFPALLHLGDGYGPEGLLRGLCVGF